MFFGYSPKALVGLVADKIRESDRLHDVARDSLVGFFNIILATLASGVTIGVVLNWKNEDDALFPYAPFLGQILLGCITLYLYRLLKYVHTKVNFLQLTGTYVSWLAAVTLLGFAAPETPASFVGTLAFAIGALPWLAFMALIIMALIRIIQLVRHETRGITYGAVPYAVRVTQPPHKE